MSTAAEPRPSTLKVWLLACRPATLLAGVTPVVVGAALALANGVFQLGPALGALLGATFIQIGTNLANDYYDFKKGADTDARLGPARAAQKGWLSPREVATGTAVALGLAFLTGLYLVSVAGWPILALGLVSIALAVGYTGGPYPWPTTAWAICLCSSSSATRPWRAPTTSRRSPWPPRSGWRLPPSAPWPRPSSW